ncbi:CPBP family intramembrane metalloprotease [Mucilaginibacter rigui]|uniref:CPBP family intramembrane metalloprotease n=1 Tax=Mucilaginibacter rigui TaxID=534635 RepID=A0ABR7X3W5_9SPHI|nr:CPBP family intramembrane glutamic endopeptidase [Mucilaginibacter rigui]MBD1385263.1 CPBP family intramembrane metalloprotease [Mucilaginibacter rigui]
MMKTPVNQMSPGLQFLLFVVVFAAIFIIGNLLGIAIIAVMYGLNLVMEIAQLNFTNPQSIPALYILQIVTTTIPIFLAPVIFGYWVAKAPSQYIKPTIRIPWMLFIVAFFVMLFSPPLIEFLSNINQQMVLPKWLNGLERWMKESEESARRMTGAILNMQTIGDCIKNIILIGLLTAIAEEFMFRGVIQTILQKWTKNTHVAIWVTAAIFSAFHMEFYGFLPRLLLGALFGYFVAWSGSIWPAVWGHFLNNGSAVVITYLYQKKYIKLNPDDTTVFSWWQYIFSLIIIIILLLVYKKIALGKKQPELNGEELG